MTNKINGIDVSECPHYDKVAGCFHTLEGKCIKDKCSIYKLILKNQYLQEENEELKKQLEFSRTHKATLDAERIKYKQALEEIEEIIEFCFKTAYMAFELKESNKIIEDIEKIVNEVLK